MGGEHRNDGNALEQDSFWTRRRALGVLCGLTLGGMGTFAYNLADATARPRLFVFVPTLIRARALSALLEASLDGVQVTVFGRFADFRSATASLQPDAALALEGSLSALGLKATLAGAANGETTEPYVVLTHRPQLDVGTLAQSTLGMVDIVGREALPSLVRAMLHLKSEPQVRRVIKVADLVPLLALDLAGGIVVQQRFVAELRSNSRQELRVIKPVDASLGRTAVAFPGDKNGPIRAGLQRLPVEVRQALGVDQWEPRP